MKSACDTGRYCAHCRSSDDAFGTEANHWKLLIRMTSLLRLPRVSANWPPSGDHLKSKISPDSKFVICFGGPPVSFCRQRLETPFLVNAYSTASPSGAQRAA